MRSLALDCFAETRSFSRRGKHRVSQNIPLPEPVLRRNILALQKEWPALVEPLLDALSSVSRRVPLTPEGLAALNVALTSSRTALYETASYIAEDASGFDSHVVDLITDLSRHQKAFARRNAILCLGEDTPEVITVEVIAAGLKDKSALVRIKAADWVLRMRLVQALPMVTAAVCIEKHAEARSVMECTLGMLRDGHVARPRQGDYVSLTVLGNGGGSTTARVKQALIDEVGMEKVASDLRGGPCAG